MREIGIRELKRRASDVVREVATGEAVYTVTKRGRPVGVLVPPDYLSAGDGAARDGAWDRVLALADRLSAEGGRRSAVRELGRMRR
jgi:prevent-host-death family protein